MMTMQKIVAGYTAVACVAILAVIISWAFSLRAAQHYDVTFEEAREQIADAEFGQQVIEYLDGAQDVQEWTISRYGYVGIEPRYMINVDVLDGREMTIRYHGATLQAAFDAMRSDGIVQGVSVGR